MNTKKYEESKFSGKGLIEEAVRHADGMRLDVDNPVDVSFAEVIKEKHGVTLSAFYEDLGINPNYDTIQNIVSIPDVDANWIIPEFIRDSIRIGYRQSPIWPNIIAGEEQMKGLTNVMPHVNMSDSVPAKVNEGETIPLGTISYGSRKFEAYKLGKGIKLTYEVIQHSSLNVVGIFLEDFGVKLGHGTDILAINTLLNGEQADGSNSAPVIGVASAGTLTYADILKIWIRMGRLGRVPGTMVGGEDVALLTWNLAEFKNRRDYYAPQADLKMHMPIPASTDYFVHGNIPASKQIILDKTRGIIKFNANPLMVESEKIVSNQTEASYATVSMGFAKLFRDSAIVLDKSVAFSGAGFPTYMDVDAMQNSPFE